MLDTNTITVMNDNFKCKYSINSPSLGVIKYTNCISQVIRQIWSGWLASWFTQCFNMLIIKPQVSVLTLNLIFILILITFISYDQMSKQTDFIRSLIRRYHPLSKSWVRCRCLTCFIIILIIYQYTVCLKMSVSYDDKFII